MTSISSAAGDGDETKCKYRMTWHEHSLITGLDTYPDTVVSKWSYANDAVDLMLSQAPFDIRTGW